MITVVLFGVFIVLFLLHVPIGISLAISSVVALFLTGDFSLFMIAQRMFTGMDSTPLMAIPGFVFAGVIMAHGGISKYLIDFLRAWIGHVRGGLSIVVMMACMIFAAISGSSPATAAAVGGIMIPAMVAGGYDKKYAMGAVAAGGTIGILIPPSITFVLIGVTAEQSIGKLFTAGIIPGILLTLLFSTTAVIYARIKNYGGDAKANWEYRKKATIKAIPGILMPVMILTAIYAGIATPTEVSFLSVAYALIVGAFIYKEITFSSFKRILRESITTTSMIFLIIAAAMTFALYLAAEQVPQQVVQWVAAHDISQFTFWCFTFVMFLVLGTFLEAVSIVLITLPVLLPVIHTLGINIIHFAVFMVMMMEMAMITPPVGLNLFVVAGIAREKLENVIIGVLPFMLTMAVAVLLIVLFPQIPLFLLN
ncbi:MAG: TRAP transporter large permease [Bacillota bacterium]|jgi:C4-dicarboxylate transporter DctM subunit